VAAFATRREAERVAVVSPFVVSIVALLVSRYDGIAADREAVAAFVDATVALVERQTVAAAVTDDPVPVVTDLVAPQVAVATGRRAVGRSALAAVPAVFEHAVLRATVARHVIAVIAELVIQDAAITAARGSVCVERQVRVNASVFGGAPGVGAAGRC